jgi:hypothetical protein
METSNSKSKPATTNLKRKKVTRRRTVKRKASSGASSFSEDWDSKVFPCRASIECKGKIFYGKESMDNHLCEVHDMNIQMYKFTVLKLKDVSPFSTSPEESNDETDLK